MAPNKIAASKAHHTIQQLEVTGGFLRNAKLEFVDGLNCIIGGRGTGKTTVLELLRYVLGLMPDPKTSTARGKVLAGLVQNNLGNGRIRVDVETKHGMKYSAERAWQEQAEVRNESGNVVPISFDRDLIFKADVYSQHEIEEIALSAPFQLALLDKFIDEDIRRLSTETKRLERDLERNAGELVRLTASIQDLQDTSTEIVQIQEKLRVFESPAGPHSDALNSAHAQRSGRQKEKAALEAVRSDLERIGTELSAAISTHTRRLSDRHVDDPIGPNPDVFETLAEATEELLMTLHSARQLIQEKVDAARRTALEAQSILTARHADQERQFRDVVERLEEQAGRALERAQLEQRLLELTEARRDLEAKKGELRAREDERQNVLASLNDLRDERFRLRESVAQQLTRALAPMIRVTITQEGNRGVYRELLDESLKGAGLKQGVIADRISESLSPEAFAALVQRNDAMLLAERANLGDVDRAQKVIDALRDRESIHRIEVVTVDDLPKIELLDGKEYKDSGALSTGQRCTTILPILLQQSERPLLIDQPEDNLDNRFLYDTVIRCVREAKGSRQLIFVTHNPNIPVLGDAERIFLLTSDGKHASVAKVGTVDDLKTEIEDLMEGGREAYLLRGKRYGHYAD